MKKLLFLSMLALTSFAMQAMEETALPPSAHDRQENYLFSSANPEVRILAHYADARNAYFSGIHNIAYQKLTECAAQSTIPWIKEEAQEYLQKMEKSRRQFPDVTIKPSFKHIDAQEQLMQRTLNEATYLYYNKKDLMQARNVYRRVLRFNTPGDINIEAQHRHARAQIRTINEQLAEEKTSNANAARDIFK